MSNCCWVGLLLCACLVFPEPSVEFGCIAGHIAVSVKLFDCWFFIWCLRSVTVLDAVDCAACICLVVSSGLGMPWNAPGSACRTSPLRRIPAFIWFLWSCWNDDASPSMLWPARFACVRPAAARPAWEARDETRAGCVRPAVVRGAWPLVTSLIYR